MAPFSALQVANSGYTTFFPISQQFYFNFSEKVLQFSYPSLPLANYLHNKIFPDFARFSLLFFAPYVIIIM